MNIIFLGCLIFSGVLILQGLSDMTPQKRYRAFAVDEEGSTIELTGTKSFIENRINNSQYELIELDGIS